MAEFKSALFYLTYSRSSGPYNPTMLYPQEATSFQSFRGDESLSFFGFFVNWHINLCRLFNAKAILLEEQLWNNLTHS